MKLLSPKPLENFSQDEYYAYIKSLNRPRVVYSNKKEQKDLKVRVKRRINGSLSIVTKRSPLYITDKELEKISTEKEIPMSELYTVLKARGYNFYPDHRTAEKELERGENG